MTKLDTVKQLFENLVFTINTQIHSLKCKKQHNVEEQTTLMCFLEVAGWKDRYQIHQLPLIDTSQRGMGDTTTQCCLPLSSTPCTLHKTERAANGEDLQRTRDSWSPGSDKQVSVISTSYCMILHNQLSACAQKQNKSSESTEANISTYNARHNYL